MTRVSLLFNAAQLIGFQTLWIWFAFAAMLSVNSSFPMARQISWCLWGAAVILLAVQAILILVYPEWPINLRLCRRVKNGVLDRLGDSECWEDRRVVELVPRENWERNLIETASDLLLLNVSDQGVVMEGDRDRYELPANSILGAEFQSIRPPGWLTQTNMVIITAKTVDGAIELPIAFRDHQLGQLSNSKRRAQAIKLTQTINRIARADSFHVTNEVLAIEPQRSFSMNPYAAPQT